MAPSYEASYVAQIRFPRRYHKRQLLKGYMSAKTSIEWTGRTWNPLVAYLTRDVEVIRKNGDKVKIPAGTRGWFCTKCSPGCLHCYAEKINLRLGNGLTYQVKNLNEIEFRLVNLDAPLRWRKPGFVFVNSMTDLFHEAVPKEMVDQVFAVMAIAGQQTFQVLTKRATVMRAYFENPQVSSRLALAVQRTQNWQPHAVDLVRSLPLPNVWLGVSAENQKYWDERVEQLGATPAAVRFVSAEPLLGDIDCGNAFDPPPERSAYSPIDWVIVGGESGARARTCNLNWIRSLVRQCVLNEVPVFVKQLGSKPYDEAPYIEGDPHFKGWTLVHLGGQKFWNQHYRLKDRKGGDSSEWGAEFRVRQMPERVA